jgi:hypothetical protein
VTVAGMLLSRSKGKENSHYVSKNLNIEIYRTIIYLFCMGVKLVF